MLDVAPVLDPARRALESATSGTKRDRRSAAREALEASRELRRAAHDMRRAVERFPRGSTRLPAASSALADAARAVREAAGAAREMSRDGIRPEAVLEAIRADLDIAAGAASDAAALGMRALAPLPARIGDSLGDLPETVRSAGSGASTAVTSAAVKSAAVKRASAAARKASRRASQLDPMSVVGAVPFADLVGVARPAGRLVASMRPAARRETKRRMPSLTQFGLFVIVPALLLMPLLMLVTRRRNGWTTLGDDEADRTDGTTGAVGEAD
ncbi:MAG TPA: hypothetical protein VF802_02625, partial [Candidatus Limnocylindrales bacterium]